MSSTVYAQGTKVSPKTSRDEIERILQRYGATAFGFMADSEKAAIQFEWKKRRMRFTLPLAVEGRVPQARIDQIRRERWRALVLSIKAKLETVNSNIKTVDQEFTNEIVLPTGQTVGESIQWAIREAYQTNKTPRVFMALPAPDERPVIDLDPEGQHG